MKKIETKTAKNGAKLYYVDGKRVARAKAIEIAENNARERISSLFDNNVDEAQAQVVVIAKVKDEFDNRVEERFFFAGAEAGIAAAEKIAAEFGRKAIIGVDDLLTKKAIATSNRWGEIRISDSYKAAQTSAREKLAQAFDEECDRAQAQAVLTVNVKDELGNDVTAEDSIFTAEKFFPTVDAAVKAGRKVIETFGEKTGELVIADASDVVVAEIRRENSRISVEVYNDTIKFNETLRGMKDETNCTIVDGDFGAYSIRSMKAFKVRYQPSPTACKGYALWIGSSPVRVYSSLGEIKRVIEMYRKANRRGEMEFVLPTAEDLNIQRAEKIIEDCYNTKGWGNPVYHWYNPVEDDGSNDDDDEPSAFNLLPAVDSLRDVDDEGGNDSGADTEPAQETTIDAAQEKFLVTPYGVLPRVDREKLAADIEKFSGSSKTAAPVEFIRRVLYTIDKPVDVDALAAMEHIENGFEDLRNFIRFVGRKEGLTVAQCEAIYAELYCDCNKADTVYDDAFYARRDMLIDKFKAQNAAQVADKRKAQKTAPLAGRAPAVINAEFDEIVEEWIREDRAEKNTVDKIKISTRALPKYLGSPK